ncbi:Sapep family Mn(2+)-dependent dipeptidase [Oscillospiraceae bacterium OttesenSCG-928-F05]|nr:Sapep family Mn(2+)-dependent dipeptidase [Oscillospiraceae bacterium OttesenSCG-928-F05]
MFQPNGQLIAEIDTFLSENRTRFVDDLRELVKIPGVSEPDERYPYGAECARALDRAMAMAEGYGFTVRNREYHCATCHLDGNGSTGKTIGIFEHLDVVPVSDDWAFPPFDVTEKDGYLIGRGVSDNKGMAVAALYALRFLKEKGIPLKNDIYLFFGLSEETGMQDITYFCDTYGAPDFGLVADTKYPVCFGEKGILRFASWTKAQGNLTDFHAGNVVNTIPAAAVATLSSAPAEALELLRKTERITVTEEGGQIKVASTGISKHASMPEGSINAVYVLADALTKSGALNGSVAEAVAALAHFTSDAHGRTTGVPFEDAESGKLSCVGSVVRMAEGVMTVKYDIRYPVTVKGDDVRKGVSDYFAARGFETGDFDDDAPSFVQKDHPIPAVLGEISDYVLGRHLEPYTMGGGTYARQLPLAIGFGMADPDDQGPFEAGRGGAHQPDEAVKRDTLLMGIKAYILALIEADKLI